MIVVQETEYTGAGKHPTAQLTFARELGVEVRRGPSESDPGRSIVIPAPRRSSRSRIDLDQIRRSFLSRVVGEAGASSLSSGEVEFLAAEVKRPPGAVAALLAESGRAGTVARG